MPATTMTTDRMWHPRTPSAWPCACSWLLYGILTLSVLSEPCDLCVCVVFSPLFSLPSDCPYLRYLSQSICELTPSLLWSSWEAYHPAGSWAHIPVQLGNTILGAGTGQGSYRDQDGL